MKPESPTKAPTMESKASTKAPKMKQDASTKALTASNSATPSTPTSPTPKSPAQKNLQEIDSARSVALSTLSTPPPLSTAPPPTPPPPPTPKERAQTRMHAIDAALSSSTSTLQGNLSTAMSALFKSHNEEITQTMADIDEKFRLLLKAFRGAELREKHRVLEADIKAEGEAHKARYRDKVYIESDAFMERYRELVREGVERKMDVVEEEGLSVEEAMELLGIGEGVVGMRTKGLGMGADQIAALKAAFSGETEPGAERKSIPSVDPKDVASYQETETGGREKGITSVGFKDAASSQETGTDANEKKSTTSVGSEHAASSWETKTDAKETSTISVVSLRKKAEAKEKSTTSVSSIEDASSLQNKMLDKKERPTYEQKVMVLDSDQMAALEAKMANVMRRRH